MRRKSPINTRSKMKVGERTIRNLFEEQIYKQALENSPEGSIVEYETDKVEYIIKHEYTPDIPVTLPNGKKFYIEVKGNGRAWTPDVRRKMLEVRKQNPSIDIRFVFYSDGKFGNPRKDGTFQTQSEWAKKHGFLYSIKTIPEEWFQDNDL